jgi:hypothetical protein
MIFDPSRVHNNTANITFGRWYHRGMIFDPSRVHNIIAIIEFGHWSPQGGFHSIPVGSTLFIIISTQLFSPLFVFSLYNEWFVCSAPYELITNIRKIYDEDIEKVTLNSVKNISSYVPVDVHTAKIEKAMEEENPQEFLNLLLNRKQKKDS